MATPDTHEPLKEKPIIFDTKVHKEALWSLLSDVLMQRIQREVGLKPGENEQFVQHNRVLRDVALQLVQDLDKRIYSIEALWLGLTPLIPDEKLKEWALITELPDPSEYAFHITAQYLYKEKLQGESGK